MCFSGAVSAFLDLFIRSSTNFLDCPSCNPQHTTVPLPNTHASPDTSLEDDGSLPAVTGVHRASSKRMAEAGKALRTLVNSYFSAVANVYTGWMAPRVGFGLARIGKEAEAVRFRDDGDLFGFGFGWVEGAWAKRRVVTDGYKYGCCRIERKIPGSRGVMCQKVQNCSAGSLPRLMLSTVVFEISVRSFEHDGSKSPLVSIWLMELSVDMRHSKFY